MSRPIIKTAMNIDGIGAGREVSWDTMEIRQFHDCARKQGWDETDLVVTRFVGEDDVGMAGPFVADWFGSVADRYGMDDKVAFVPMLWKDEDARKRNHYGTFTDIKRMRCLMRASPNKQLAWRYLEYFFSQEWLSKYVSRRGLPFVRGQYLGMFGNFRAELPWKMVRHDVTPEVPLDDEVIEMVKPLEQYVLHTPMMTKWPQASVALAEVFVDYYLGRHASAQQALQVAEDRFMQIVDDAVRPENAQGSDE